MRVNPKFTVFEGTLLEVLFGEGVLKLNVVELESVSQRHDTVVEAMLVGGIFVTTEFLLLLDGSVVLRVLLKWLDMLLEVI